MTPDVAVDREAQAKASVEANADYVDPVSAVRSNTVPQLPDPEKLAVNQAVSQGGARPTVDSYEGVDIQDDGTRIGEGATDPQEAAASAAESGGSDEKLTGKALEARLDELGIDGSGLSADEKRAAVAEAEAAGA